MWKDSIRNIVVIFQPNILIIVGLYVRHSAIDTYFQISLIYAFIGCSQSKPNLIGSVKLHKTNRLNLCLRDIYNRRNNLQALALQKVASNSCRFVCWSTFFSPWFLFHTLFVIFPGTC